MKLLRRQHEPEPEEDDGDLAPPFGVHPMIDLMAMQHYLIKQQRDIWLALETFHKRQLFNAKAWVLMSLCWLFIALVQCWNVFVR